jgi:CheY-specific phosphatase CheX
VNIETVKDLGRLFAEVLIEVAEKSTGCALQVKSSDQDAGLFGMTGVMNLNGQKQMLLFITMDVIAIRLLCSKMIGVPQRDVTADDMIDTISELVNMTAGNAKLRLGDTDHKFSLTTPFTITGSNVSVVMKKRVNVISMAIGNDEISMKLMLCC